jgi:hypothetical protein
MSYRYCWRYPAPQRYLESAAQPRIAWQLPVSSPSADSEVASTL